MKRLIAWLFRRRRQPQRPPLPPLKHPERLGVHIALATERAVTNTPNPFVR